MVSDYKTGVKLRFRTSAPRGLDEELRDAHNFISRVNSLVATLSSKDKSDVNDSNRATLMLRIERVSESRALKRLKSRYEGVQVKFDNSGRAAIYINGEEYTPD